MMQPACPLVEVRIVVGDDVSSSCSVTLQPTAGTLLGDAAASAPPEGLLPETTSPNNVERECVVCTVRRTKWWSPQSVALSAGCSICDAAYLYR